jgi:hypothetical protein
VSEEKRDRSTLDGEGYGGSCTMAHSLRSTVFLNNTRTKKHLGSDVTHGYWTSGLQTATTRTGQPTKQRIGASRSVVADVAYRGVNMDKCNRVWRFGADMSARDD